MLAVAVGCSRVVRILLKNGANAYLVCRHDISSLHTSAEGGHLAVTKMMIKAGVDLEGKTSTEGATPLQMAASRGHSKVMKALIDAGANPNSRKLDGRTALCEAAVRGHMDAVKVLLLAKADPLLSMTFPGLSLLPLDLAAGIGHLEMVRWMIHEVGIEECGGATGGARALGMAARDQYVDIMAVLTDAGVVDNGEGLAFAAVCGSEASVKFLLRQDWNTSGAVAYVNMTCDDLGHSPLVGAIIGVASVDLPSISPSVAFPSAFPSIFPRIVRLLVDAGADTTSIVRLKNTEETVTFSGTPLALATTTLREKKVGGQDATQEQLQKLEGIRRLLLRVEAIHAVSWLWPGEIFSIEQAVEGTARSKKTSTPVALMLPILRRRAARPRVLLPALYRWVVKNSCL